MPNSAHSSPTARSRKRRRRRSPVSDVQSAIRDTTTELRRVDRQLGEISDSLPQANGEFDMLAELRGAIDTVRSDLLSDAIATLDTAGSVTEPDLRCRFTERQGWLAEAEE